MPSLGAWADGLAAFGAGLAFLAVGLAWLGFDPATDPAMVWRRRR